jgi:protein SCO1/2
MRATLLRGIVVMAGLFSGSANADPIRAAAPLETGFRLPVPLALAPFRLQSHDGGRFDRTALIGTWTLLSIGYTHCPDVCPATLSQLRIVTERAAAERWSRAPLRVVFLTVDPRRDDVRSLRAYVGFFGSRTVGITGAPADVDRLIRSLHAKYERVPGGTHDEYYVDHTATVSLIGPDARLRAVFQQPLHVDAVMRDLRALLRVDVP